LKKTVFVDLQHLTAKIYLAHKKVPP